MQKFSGLYSGVKFLLCGEEVAMTKHLLLICGLLFTGWDAFRA